MTQSTTRNRHTAPLPSTRCNTCGGPATAGQDLQRPMFHNCISCAAAATVSIPPSPEKLAKAPNTFITSPAWPIASAVARGDTLWLHQATGLNHIVQDRNIVISTPTASGKSLVFQLPTLHFIANDPDATALVFYPTKALANDQARRWREACAAIGLPPTATGQVDGDVPMNRRDAIVAQANILLATPDVAHAWLARRASSMPVIKFLANLRLIIIDEAHTYESILGSNSAYLFRRLTAAAANAGNPATPRFIAATATIRNPQDHLELLTGQEFTVIDHTENGAPRYSREIHHLPLIPGKGSAEDQLSRLIKSILDNDPDAQLIVFHDSRQGIERIVQTVDRPDSVLPYRSGYLAQDRRNIEDRLRNNTIRAIVSTSALELGIDMPDLNYGLHLDLPPSRKQFHQRIGRIGRARPGTFIILAPRNRFSAYGDTLEGYFNNSVEPSNLYLDNEYISHQQALCLKRELNTANQDARVPPDTSVWPAHFDQSLRDTHGRTPPHLQSLTNRSSDSPPQLAYSIRSTGEENLEIIPLSHDTPPIDQRSIGYITIRAAIREAYPGALYHHKGQSYLIEEWARRPSGRQPFLRATPVASSHARTKPAVRTVASIAPSNDSLIDDHQTLSEVGSVTELRLTITESVEGYKPAREGLIRYRELSKKDPRKTRKAREFPTTGVLITIDQPWFTGESGEPWRARHQVAHALRLYLAYQRSIALPDLSAAVENITVSHPSGYYLLDNSILVYDSIFGGLGLTTHLQRNLLQYAVQLTKATDYDDHARFINPDNAALFLQWVRDLYESPPTSPIQPGAANWWRILNPGTPAKVFSPQAKAIVPTTVGEHRWDHKVLYSLDTQHGPLEASEDQLTGTDRPDWVLWQPSSGRHNELFLDYDDV